LLLTLCDDFPHMNMENRSARPPDLDEPASPEGPVDQCEPAFAIRQQLWERAQRLYGIGELNQAAKLLSELAAGTGPHEAEGQWEALHG
jgi:hypothetical protein